MNLFSDKVFRKFVIQFLLVFCIAYFGTLAVIGLAAPEGRYSAFVDHYADYVSWMRWALLGASKWMMSFFGADTYITPDFHLRYVNGRGVYLAYDCVGYGVMSFWIALVLAFPGKWIKKAGWLLSGLLILYVINVARISLFLYVTNKNSEMPLGIDHHTWFNIFAYLAIFIMLYYFYRSTDDSQGKRKAQDSTDNL